MSDQTPVTDRSSRRLIIAIDGPSGAGKGTVARAVATALGYQHVDTGAMYRAIAWKALCEGVDLGDEQAAAGWRGGLRCRLATAWSWSTAGRLSGDSHA